MILSCKKRASHKLRRKGRKVEEGGRETEYPIVEGSAYIFSSNIKCRTRHHHPFSFTASPPPQEHTTRAQHHTHGASSHGALVLKWALYIPLTLLATSHLSSAASDPLSSRHLLLNQLAQWRRSRFAPGPETAAAWVLCFLAASVCSAGGVGAGPSSCPSSPRGGAELEARHHLLRVHGGGGVAVERALHPPRDAPRPAVLPADQLRDRAALAAVHAPGGERRGGLQPDVPRVAHHRLLRRVPRLLHVQDVWGWAQVLGGGDQGDWQGHYERVVGGSS
uniref:Uncharacterized protein n=1 Tax=Ananas comosus var. bracteatus TaxID=296719 RepID=A0A6V7PF78_ANACO|nr:unnamed protein product [Ananas comosus var. bracteatus]